MGAPTLLKQAAERLSGLEAYGVSRHRHKHRRPGSPLSGSSGRLHSTKTSQVYYGCVKAYVSWIRTHHPQYRHLWRVDKDADALVTGYLRFLLAADPPYSAFSLAQARSALRFFHADATLGGDVALPKRTRVSISNNRGPAITRGRVNLETHAQLISFLESTGLRRREVSNLRVKHVLIDTGGTVRISVPKGKGGRPRMVVPLGNPTPIVALVAGKHRNDLLFPVVPSALRIQAIRRRFAKACYLAHSTMPLPAAEGRLLPGHYDRAAALYVSGQLGHNRVDVARGYLRD